MAGRTEAGVTGCLRRGQWDRWFRRAMYKATCTVWACQGEDKVYVTGLGWVGTAVRQAARASKQASKHRQAAGAKLDGHQMVQYAQSQSGAGQLSLHHCITAKVAKLPPLRHCLHRPLPTLFVCRIPSTTTPLSSYRPPFFTAFPRVITSITSTKHRPLALPHTLSIPYHCCTCVTRALDITL